MSAIVYGKRSFFEELSQSPPVSSKRLRCSSTSPIRFSPTSFSSLPFPIPSSSPFNSDRISNHISPAVAALDHLISIFPDMEKELLERALQECGNDLDSAIKSLNELRLSSTERNITSAEENIDLPSQEGASSGGFERLKPFEVEDATYSKLQEAADDISQSSVGLGIENTAVDTTSSEDPVVDNLLKNGSEWVELFVSEMTSASNMDDARARASRVLEVLEKSIRTHASVEAAKNFENEHMLLKEQMETLIRENTILKRAVSIQHERQKEHDGRTQELQQLKQLVAQYQEQLRTLEVNNYALTMHLRQAQQSSSISGRFHPDVF